MQTGIKAFFALALLIVLSIGVLQIPPVQDVLIDKVIRSRLSTTDRQPLFADDALRLLVCGSSSPFPDPDRARPCLTVIAGGKFYVVDTGPGSWNRLALLRIPGDRIGGVFLTHFHSDHIGELGEFNLQTWVAGRGAPLQVYGPTGVEQVVDGFQQAYALDRGYRVAHHGAEMLSPDDGLMQAHTLSLSADGSMTEAFVDGDLKVSVFPVTHTPISPAVGYRFDYKGRSLVISGDTIKDANLIRAAKGADLLAHEAQNQQMVGQIQAAAADLGRTRYAKVMADIPSYHTSPVEAAEVANEAGVPLLLMYHLTPPPPNRIAEMAFLRGVAEIRSKGVVLAQDGTLIELPLDGTPAQVSVLKP
ncbi:MBL fold metallo-hydrolase [Sinimarinibacterium sp. CAU 1509]|uniref:MBL fold metallo-hydrolase n=1 Tax=Sinimarinibacterium sp. CAU 1509 TaxID=2562283 RepID=UPI00146D82DB|nr:MBL fold metallo-hydrolase [Sinimarinibacterium sp. CAU 1509]